jgi:glutamate decarboxylase
LTKNGEPETREFLERVVELLIEFAEKSYDAVLPVLDFHHPEQLLEILDLSLPEQPRSLQQLIDDCKDTLKYQVKTGKSIQLH